MAAPTSYEFPYREIVALLIQRAGLTEGEWALLVHFTTQAMNVNKDGGDLVPAALLCVTKVGLVRVNEPNALSVKAEEAENVAPIHAPRLHH